MLMNCESLANNRLEGHCLEGFLLDKLWWEGGEYVVRCSINIKIRTKIVVLNRLISHTPNCSADGWSLYLFA
jgi:hypothetical protein